MTKYPVKLQGQVVNQDDQNVGEFMEPFSSTPFPQSSSFMSFHYSYSEISSQGDKAFMKSKKASFENGKLTSESFEGTMDRNAYDQMVTQGQNLMQSQANLFMNSLSLFLPFHNKRQQNKD